jgi:hypothetical protein
MSQLADNNIVFLPESERIVQQNPLSNALDERLVKLIDAAEAVQGIGQVIDQLQLEKKKPNS